MNNDYESVKKIKRAFEKAEKSTEEAFLIIENASLVRGKLSDKVFEEQKTVDFEAMKNFRYESFDNLKINKKLLEAKKTSTALFKLISE